MTDICGYEMMPTCVYWLRGECNRNPCRFLHKQAQPTPCMPVWNLHPLFDMDRVFVGGMQNFSKVDKPKKPMKLVQWTRPPQGFVKINCDGALTVHGNKAAAGGVARDSEGRYLFGFSSGLGNFSRPEAAELLAIKIGVELALSRGYSKLIIESDCYVAVQFINSKLHKDHIFSPIVSSIIEMGKKTDQISWKHVFRETNSVADGLAKHGLSLCEEDAVKVFDTPPYFIEFPLYSDRTGTIYCR